MSSTTPVGAAGQPIFDTSSIEANGNVTIEGMLNALRIGANSAPEAPHEIDLRAERLVLETDNEVVDHQVLGVALTPPRSWTDAVEHENATVRSIEVRAAHRAFIAALPDQQRPTIRLQGHAQTVTGAGPDRMCYDEFPRAEDRDIPCARSVDAQFVASSNATAYGVIEGTFLLALWEWDIAVEDDGTVTVYTTGENYDTVAENPTGSGPGIGAIHARQVFAVAHNASLTLPIGAMSVQRFAVHADFMSWQDQATFRDAFDIGDRTPEPRDVRVPGPFQVALRPSGAERIQATPVVPIAAEPPASDQEATIEGRARSVDSEGAGTDSNLQHDETKSGPGTAAPRGRASSDAAADTSASPAAAPTSSAWAIWLSILAFVALSLVALYHAPPWKVRRWRRAMSDQRYRAVARSPWYPMQWSRHREEAAVMRAVAMLQHGSSIACSQFLAQLRNRKTLDDGTQAYLEASAAAQAGHVARATAALRRCIRYDAGFYATAATNPLLAPIISRLEAAATSAAISNATPPEGYA